MRIVSIEGYDKIHKTKTGLTVPEASISRLQIFRDKKAIKQPINNDPESPIKILAGVKLKFRKESNEQINKPQIKVSKKRLLK